MRVFLDTNILLDVLLNRQPLVADSEAVILRCEAFCITACITALSAAAI